MCASEMVTDTFSGLFPFFKNDFNFSHKMELSVAKNALGPLQTQSDRKRLEMTYHSRVYQISF